MGNCLVTKLKSVVDNDNLVVLGKVRTLFTTSTVKVPIFIANSGRWVSKFAQGSIDSVVVSVDNGAYFTNYNSEQSLGNTITIYKAAPIAYDLYVPNLTTRITYDKYETPFIKGDFDMVDLQYLFNVYSVLSQSSVDRDIVIDNKIINFEANYISGNITLGSNLELIKLRGGDVDKIIFNSEAVNGLAVECYGDGSKGFLSSLNSITYINSINFYNSGVSGNLNSLFDEWAARGKEGNCSYLIFSSPISASGSLVLDYSRHTVNFANGSWSFVS